MTGGVMLWADSTQRSADGYLTSPTYNLQSDGYALTAEEIHLGGPSPDDWFGWYNRFEIRLDVESAGSDPVFVGVGPRSQVDVYLDGVPHAAAEGCGSLSPADRWVASYVSRQAVRWADRVAAGSPSRTSQARCGASGARRRSG